MSLSRLHNVYDHHPVQIFIAEHILHAHIYYALNQSFTQDLVPLSPADYMKVTLFGLTQLRFI